jgi:hypothetical protein
MAWKVTLGKTRREGELGLPFELSWINLSSHHQNNLLRHLETNDTFPIASEYDVIVDGAGPAGVAAAIASARDGAKTLLFTHTTTLGGFSANTFAHSLCGLYVVSQDIIPRLANGGLALEFIEHLINSSTGGRSLRVGPFDMIFQSPFLFAQQCQELCEREKNLTVLLNTRLVSVEASETRIESVSFEEREEPVRARAFVDSTSEAELAFLSGADFEEAESCLQRRQSFIFSIRGQEADATDDEGRRRFSQLIVEGIRSGVLSPQIGLAVMRLEQIDENPDACVGLDAEGDHFSALNPDSLIRFQILSKNLAMELENYLRANMPGFQKSDVAVVPAQACEREIRSVTGRYRLTEADLQSCPDFEDAVCRSGWPILADPSLLRARVFDPSRARTCAVPLRSLISKGIGNLLMAGRCISSAYVAQGALRMIGTSLAIGQASGLAAAATARSEEMTIPEGSEANVAARIRAAFESGL